MKVRHDLTRRRTLKRKSELLRQYGIWTLVGCYGMLGAYWFNRWMHPREYTSEEEQTKD